MAPGSQNWLNVFKEDPYKQDDTVDETFADDFANMAEMPAFDFPTSTVPPVSSATSSIQMSDLLANSRAEMFKELVLVSCSIVIFCQVGFGMCHCGLSRSKNALLACFVIFLNTFLVILGHWGAGHTFATTQGSYFIGYSHLWFSESMHSSSYLTWLRSLCFAVTTINIIPGGLLERVEPYAYVTLAVFFSAIVHPVVIHSAWHPEGWLQSVHIHSEPVVYQDFAGSGTVHVFAGIAALIGSILAGPRFRKFSPIKTQNFNSHLLGHSLPLYSLGGFLIIFGFISLHISRAYSDSSVDGAAVVMVNTLIATTISALTSFMLVQLIRVVVKCCCWDLCKVKWPVMTLLINGALAGIAAVAAGCNVYFPWASAVVGFVAGCAYVFWSFGLSACSIDDPADVFASHAGGGLWGIIAVAIFGRNGIIFYPTTTNYKILAWNIAGGTAIAVWSGLLTCVCLGPLRLCRRLCVSEEVERRGLDVSLFGELAYPFYAWRQSSEDDGIHDSRSDDERKAPVNPPDPDSHSRSDNERKSSENRPDTEHKGHRMPLDLRHSVGVYDF